METQKWMWLAHGLGFGAIGAGEILSEFLGGAAEVYDCVGSLRLRALLRPKQLQRLLATKPDDFVSQIGQACARGIAIVPFAHPQYPQLLKTTPCPPPLLYVKGDVNLLNAPLCLAVVGTRTPSVYGTEVVRTLGGDLARGGAVLVSGLAAGLDAEAHKAALQANAPTVACIAFGHDRCYPAANRPLMETIEKHGAVISEYPLGVGIEKVYFIQRNRLIAGISRALLVTEARSHSGTMSTVDFAAEFGREVFAVPGSIFSSPSEGTNTMIFEGATPATSAADILRAMGQEDAGAANMPHKQQAPMPSIDVLKLSADAKAMLQILGAGGQTLDELCARGEFAPAAAMVCLTELEACGLAHQLAGRRFCRI